MFSVDELIYNMHHFEEENFERFDELYDEVRAGNLSTEEDAVKKLCLSFAEEFQQIHPHQYVKAVKITFMIIQRMGTEEGFRQLAEGLCGLPAEKESHVHEYIKCLCYNYPKEELEKFKIILNQQPQNEVVWRAIRKVCESEHKKLDAAREVFGEN